MLRQRASLKVQVPHSSLDGSVVDILYSSCPIWDVLFRESVEPNVHASAIRLPCSNDYHFLALPNRGTRHWSAVVTSHSTNSPLVVTSEESGSITFIHRGKSVCFDRESLLNSTTVVDALLRLLLICMVRDLCE